MKRLLPALALLVAAVATAEPQQPNSFSALRELAMKGDYQAQRNLAYGYSSWPYKGQEKNPILACAWRIVILNSGSEKLNAGDASNKRVDCDSLDRDSRAAAEAQANRISAKLGY